MSKYNLESMRKLINSKNNNLAEVIRIINIEKENGDEEDITFILEELGIESRICSICENIILEGYCIEGGYKYACSDECLNEIMTREEYKYLFDNGEGDTYYTEFTEIDRSGIPY